MMALIGMIIRVVAVATMAPIAVRVAVADDSTTPPAAALVLQQQGLGVTVNFEGRMVLGEPIVGIATIRNNGNESITVQHLDLAGSGVLAPIYKSCSMSFDDQTLQVEESVMGTCTLASNGLRPTAYLYRRHTYRLMAEAKIASRDDPLPMLVEAKLEMPELSVVYGAWSESYFWLSLRPRFDT